MYYRALIQMSHRRLTAACCCGNGLYFKKDVQLPYQEYRRHKLPHSLYHGCSECWILQTTFFVFAVLGIQLIAPFDRATITRGATHSDFNFFYQTFCDLMSHLNSVRLNTCGLTITNDDVWAVHNCRYVPIRTKRTIGGRGRRPEF